MRSVTLAAKPLPTELWVLLGGLIVAVVVLGLIIMKVRGSMLARPSESSEGLLEGLRRMRDRGELSTEEYDAARKNMVARMTGMKAPERQPAAGESRARPGFDLTGAPLPRPEPPSQGDG